MTRFISPLYDTTFKYLWKNDNSRKFFIKLIKYLTTIDLTNYHLYDNEINSGNNLKDYRLDLVFVPNDEDERFSTTINIEMYKDYHSTDSIKSFSYVFSLLSKSLKQGDTYFEKQIVQVNFNDGYFKDNKEVGSICYMISDESGKYKKNYMKIYEVYLSKYKGLCYNETNELDAMLSFLSANSYEEMEQIACGKKEALAIMDELKRLAKEEDFLPEYDFEREMRRVTNTEKEISKQEGLAEGHAEGLTEGHAKGLTEGKESAAREIASNLLKNNVDIETISKSTDLSIEELNNLKEKEVN